MGDKERFESKVDRSGGPDACHPWTAYRRSDGYALCRVTKRELAYQYGVGESTIGHLLRGESWRHVEG